MECLGELDAERLQTLVEVLAAAGVRRFELRGEVVIEFHPPPNESPAGAQPSVAKETLEKTSGSSRESAYSELFNGNPPKFQRKE